MDIKFNEELPGWANYDETIVVSELIAKIKCDTILDAGACTGKLSWSLCKTFPDKHVTSLDLFDGSTFIDRIGPYNNPSEYDRRYPKQTNTLEFFKILHDDFNHSNLSVIKSDFLDYNTYHDIIILSVDLKNIEWNKIFDHALLLNPKLIIGRHRRNNRNDVINALTEYHHTDYDHGVYVLHKKL